MIKEKIIEILKKIEEAEDTEEAIFPLMFELLEVKRMYLVEFLKFVWEEDKSCQKILKLVVIKCQKYILFENKHIENWKRFKENKYKEQEKQKNGSKR